MNAAAGTGAEKKPGAKTVADDGVELCSMRTGGMTFGVPILRILEILGAPATQPVPLAPSFIGGLVHYRGEVLTAVSLRRLLGMDAYGEASDVLVFEGSGGCYGLLVDAVGDVVTASQESFEANPPTLDDRCEAVFAGVYKLEGGLVVLLDPDRLEPMRLLAEG